MRSGLRLRKWQGVEGLAGLPLANGGEMEVDEGGFEAAVSEVGGELMELDAAFEHVCRVGMAQGVAAEVGVFFMEAAFDFGEVDGGPDAGFAHGLLVIVEGLAKRDAGAFPAAPDAGEEPFFITMTKPEAAES